MDKIGTSNIANVDLFIILFVLALTIWLKSAPRDTWLSRILATVCGCTVAAIPVVLVVADNLRHEAVYELSMIGFWLCVCLWNWNETKAKAKQSRRFVFNLSGSSRASKSDQSDGDEISLQ